jgi:hypothetical protein
MNGREGGREKRVRAKARVRRTARETVRARARVVVTAREAETETVRETASRGE